MADLQDGLSLILLDKKGATLSVTPVLKAEGDTAVGDTIVITIKNSATFVSKIEVNSSTAADEAVKATNSECILVECPRDTEGGAGHGSLVIFGAEDVSDARRAVEVCLRELERTFGDVYGNSAGHLEFQYSARASYVLNKVWGAPLGKAFGITVGAPAGIGVVLADTASKAATIDAVTIATPGNGGTSYSNEVNFFFSGDSGAVKQAIIAARDVGIQLLKTLAPDEELKSTTTPYII